MHPNRHLPRNSATRLLREIRRNKPGAFENLLRANKGVKLEQAKVAARRQRVPLPRVLEQLWHNARSNITPPHMALNASLAAQYVARRKYSPARAKRKLKLQKAEAYHAAYHPLATLEAPTIKHQESLEKFFQLLGKKLQNKVPHRSARRIETLLTIFRLWLNGYSEKKIAEYYGDRGWEAVRLSIGTIKQLIQKDPALREAVSELYEK